MCACVCVCLTCEYTDQVATIYKKYIFVIALFIILLHARAFYHSFHKIRKYALENINSMQIACDTNEFSTLDASIWLFYYYCIILSSRQV